LNPVAGYAVQAARIKSRTLAVAVSRQVATLSMANVPLRNVVRIKAIRIAGNVM